MPSIKNEHLEITLSDVSTNPLRTENEASKCKFLDKEYPFLCFYSNGPVGMEVTPDFCECCKKYGK